MREEILSGLKNAIERGTPLEKAVKSFINAGYNPAEVRAAADNLTNGAKTIEEYTSSKSNTKNNQSIINNSSVKPISKNTQDNNQKSQELPNVKKRKLKKWIIIGLIAATVLITIIILVVIFSDNILNLFSG
jgi:uncharacterized membrane protein YukC